MYIYMERKGLVTLLYMYMYMYLHLSYTEGMQLVATLGT